ncbi:MAG: hypothetical protein IJK28_05800 [Clostridia bacterium]|nr:hypothetical protein [Clostridia bacterium]
MPDRRRNIAGLLCVVLVTAILVSSAFLILEADHDCAGENCAICRMIAVNAEVLRLAGAALLALFGLLPIRELQAFHPASFRPFRSVAGSLVRLKVRLDD